MTSDRYPHAAFVALVASVALGCGGEFQMADVSGVVTLDGQPLADASVFYQPLRRDDSPVVGPASIGITDAEGRYTLVTPSNGDGAVVGSHRVSISTYQSRMKDPQNSDAIEVVSQERVPRRYRAPSELSIEVPTSGVTNADFALTSRRGPS